MAELGSQTVLHLKCTIQIDQFIFIRVGYLLTHWQKPGVNPTKLCFYSFWDSHCHAWVFEIFENNLLCCNFDTVAPLGKNNCLSMPSKCAIE